MNIKRCAKIISAVFILVFLFCSCSEPSEDLSGKWTAEEVSFSNSALADELQLTALEATYKEMTLELNSDKSGTLYYLGKDNSITWNVKQGEHWDILNVYSDGVLWKEFEIYEDGSIWLTFKTDIVVADVRFVKVK